MVRIQVLPDKLAHKIAAGEVIERPASVVKELVENSIDARANRINIQVEAGGKDFIGVSDNGVGIHKDDLTIAFHRHATSKLRTVDDLFAISSLGFRGEALPSIASVSHLTMKTRQVDETSGYKVEFSDHGEIEVSPTGCPVGTIIEVKDLFYNTPARYKFLKTQATERRHIVDFVTGISLAHPDIAFSLTVDDKLVLQTTGSGKLLETISSIYQTNLAKQLLVVQAETSWGRVDGYVGPPKLTRGNRQGQTIILNGRLIRSFMITNALEKAYHGMLGHRQYPWALLCLKIDPKLVDVNVHPAKAEVRFQDEQQVYRDILGSVKQALLSTDISRDFASPLTAKPKSKPVQSRLEFPGRRQQWKPESWNEVDRLLRESKQEFALAPQPRLGIRKENPGTIETKPPSDDPMVQPNSRTSHHQVRDQLLNARIIGQLHQTYIMLETENGLWLLDQHIIHERILYERFINEEKSVVVQQILPETLELSAKESQIIAGHLGDLEQLGFLVEPFGTNTFILRGVPSGITRSGQGWEKDIQEVCDALADNSAWREKTAVTLACKGAIKAGDYLSESQIRRLLQQLAKTENPFTCPHGRPIIVKLENQELLRRFGRA